ncbi:SWIM zinc finger family protein [Haladaptatus sp. CMAA 1911]|uniref:SWIM zinc finger family protein n=1 Tax=unclassified Haladaptatus TaxID=2622732 RepID=UPI003755094F
MSTKSPSELEADETAQNRAQAEHFSFDVDALGMVEVTNESHDKPADHQYTVSIDDVTHELMACTCPHHGHRNAFCKHMAAVENATDDRTLDTFPAEDDRISGPYTGYDKYGNVDHTYWQCEDCVRKSRGKALSLTAANLSIFPFMSRQTTLSDGARRMLAKERMQQLTIFSRYS